MGVASGCGEQEVGVASGSGWNLWVWLLGVVLKRYIDFLILLIPTPLVSVLFCSSIPTLLFIFYISELLDIIKARQHNKPEHLFFQRKKSCSGGIRTHNILLIYEADALPTEL